MKTTPDFAVSSAADGFDEFLKVLNTGHEYKYSGTTPYYGYYKGERCAQFNSWGKLLTPSQAIALLQSDQPKQLTVEDLKVGNVIRYVGNGDVRFKNGVNYKIFKDRNAIPYIISNNNIIILCVQLPLHYFILHSSQPETNKKWTDVGITDKDRVNGIIESQPENLMITDEEVSEMFIAKNVLNEYTLHNPKNITGEYYESDIIEAMIKFKRLRSTASQPETVPVQEEVKDNPLRIEFGEQAQNAFDHYEYPNLINTLDTSAAFWIGWRQAEIFFGAQRTAHLQQQLKEAKEFSVWVSQRYFYIEKHLKWKKKDGITVGEYKGGSAQTLFTTDELFNQFLTINQ